jgi:hypothetical protein
MKIGKGKALELINTKIDQFNSILNHADYDNRYDQKYEEVYYDAESLICELFSRDESMEFRRNVSLGIYVSGMSNVQELQDYKNHIEKCTSLLNAYKSKVQNFWEEDKLINLDVLNDKLQKIWNKAKQSWKLIAFVSGIAITLLTLIVLIPDAIDSFPAIKELINSTLT